MKEEGEAEAEERCEVGVFAQVGERGEEDDHHEAAAPIADETVDDENQDGERGHHHARTAVREDERHVDAVDEGEWEGNGWAAVDGPGEGETAREVGDGLRGGTEEGDTFGEGRDPTGWEEEQEPARTAREGREERTRERGET